jgi:benzoyl-CoA reductase subunit C
MKVDAIVRHAETLYGDMNLGQVRAWKAANPGRPAIGHLPVYTPRELIHACGALPVALQGGGDMVDIIKGDACFQSYICHLPRSTVELGLSGDYDCLEGLVCPSTCDVIRNLSGIWQLLFADKMVHYLDLPQSFGPAARAFYRKDLEELAEAIHKVGGRKLTSEGLAASIATFNENRDAAEALYALRTQAPHLVPTPELYLVMRAGNVLPVEEHTTLLRDYEAAARARGARTEDRIRVVAVGSFCEQPPLGLLRTLERAGCYVVEDDLTQGARMIRGHVEVGDDPLDGLVDAYCRKTQLAAVRWDEGQDRGMALVNQAKAARADGVVFMAASFCDPALLDQPRLQKALEQAAIPFTTFKYAENTGQFQGIREQAGTFADSIKLWGAA